ncbi:MAG TPA: RNA-binding cell elongation regulator Jag/EloR [Ktedonobacterales bacterium]
MESVEASGKSIEDAILQALARLGRNRDEVEIMVLQEPSRGTRGMGARAARVRVFVKQQRQARPAAGVVTPDMADELLEDDMLDEESSNGFASGELPEFVEEEAQGEYGSPAFAGDEAAEELEPLTTAPLRDLLPEDASIEEFAVAALELILGHMNVRAEVEVAEALNEEDPLILNIRSEDPALLSMLIGRRGETLASLQLLVSLIVSKQVGSRERIIVDAESYRERREQNLRAMAERIAQQVRRSGNPVTLEAMPPSERRIIHMTLSEDIDISTESTGEGDQRRVVVSLKRPARA